MLMWRLSANLMSNGATLAVKPGSTGSGTRTTPKQAVYWPTLLVPEPMKRAGSYWHCLHPSTSACSPATTGAAMAGRCRRISIWLAKYSPNALSVIIWRYTPALSGWLVKQSASHAQLRSTKKWSERLSKNTCSTNWMHYQKRIWIKKDIFFSSAPKKLAAIAYLKRHQTADSKLEKAKHKIIMREYRLFTDAILSKNIIAFYYDNEEKNASFCKAILSERHYYIFDGGVMKVSKIKHQINIIIFIITALLWFNVF